MNCKNIFEALGTDFTVVTSHGILFQKGTPIYTKEIKDGVFLLFNADESRDDSAIQAIIANFDGIDSVGRKSPKQLLFHLRIIRENDLQYLKSFLSEAI